MSIAPRTHALHLENVSHRYGNVTALENVSLDIEESELVTLLGPSGCGKTTLLRIIAGFVRPSEGRVVLEGRDVTRVPAHRRPVNMVFQRSTLFPHLDVFENVAFGLRIARLPRDEIVRRVGEALALVRLHGLDRRRAHELSGGQMQRVALARALVNRPRVLLLDEPLSALDLKIRLEMEAELRRVHRETGATFVYVTHDQREALALSDRIVVFDQGRIEQIGTPDGIYRAPGSPFAARFVGDANVLPVEIVSVAAGQAVVELVGTRRSIRCDEGLGPGPAWLVLRPEVVRLLPESADGLPGTVIDLAFRGAGYTYRIEVPGLHEPIKAETAAEAGVPVAVGSSVRVGWDSASCGLLAREDGD
jgi:ABC-type Fe3+/spermidine/putrescine transport system ATPase subunit